MCKQIHVWQFSNEIFGLIIAFDLINWKIHSFRLVRTNKVVNAWNTYVITSFQMHRNRLNKLIAQFTRTLGIHKMVNTIETTERSNSRTVKRKIASDRWFELLNDDRAMKWNEGTERDVRSENVFISITDRFDLLLLIQICIEMKHGKIHANTHQTNTRTRMRMERNQTTGNDVQRADSMRNND